jgi:hypothetical protein
MQSYLRYLDVDDLIILTSLLDSTPFTLIAKSLGITPPALSHRLRKYESHIPNFQIKSIPKGNQKVYSDSMSEEQGNFVIKQSLL